jgi:8-oxo-dGTP pyrophosphatase MutT (NUDIX family)
MRTQFGALCYRIVKDRPQVLLITSRGSGRWIIPKGWPLHGATPAEAAAAEAWEEAGAKGRIIDQCIGLYSYLKEMDEGADLPCAVLVYPMRVKTLADDFPEARQRRRRWFSLKKAAARVEEPELQQMLRGFEPRLLRR